MRLSNFVYAKRLDEHNEYTVVFHGLTMDVFLMETTLWRSLSESVTEKVDSNVRGFLEKHHILVNDNEDHSLLRDYRQKYIDELRPRIRHLYLLITSDCNLRCSYCRVPKAHVVMSATTSQKAIDLFARVRDKTLRPKITFYGGEPLLNWDVLAKSVLYAREKLGNEVEIALITNGTLLDKNKIEFIRKHSLTLGISCDGVNDSDNIFRKYADGSPAWNGIFQGVQTVAEEGYPFSVSCTLHRNNIYRLGEIVQEFPKKLQARGIAFNLLRGIPPGHPAYVPMLEQTKALIQVFPIMEKAGVYEDRLMRKVKSFVTKIPHLRDCSGMGRQIAIHPDGTITACHLTSQWGVLGSVKEGTLDWSELDKWAKRSPLLMPKCAHCPAILLCGGGCALTPLSRGLDFLDLDEEFCQHTFMILDWLLERIGKSMLKI